MMISFKGIYNPKVLSGEINFFGIFSNVPKTRILGEKIVES